MMLTAGTSEVMALMQREARPEGYALHELCRLFGYPPERMRDNLRRLVDAGLICQSEPVVGFADANPNYTLADPQPDQP